MSKYKIGDKVRISYNSSYNYYLNTDGTSSATSPIVYNKNVANNAITIIFNTATKSVESFTFNGTPLTTMVTGTLDGNFNNISFGFVCGGAQTIIESLMETVGEEGTLVMPTQSWKNLDPSTGVHWEEPEAWWDLIRANWPAYNKDVTPTNTMGAVAEIFRKWEGTERSNHPARSVAAWGKYSKFLIENHDLSNIFGIDSPIHKFYNLDGKVLLLGVGYDKNTSLHLADVLANYPSKKNCKESSAVFVNGKREWVTYETLYVDGGSGAKIKLI